MTISFGRLSERERKTKKVERETENLVKDTQRR
jgi:hypothetical protein